MLATYINDREKKHWETRIMRGIAQLAERQASNRKVDKPKFDSQCGSVSLYPWGQAVFSSWWPS